MNTENFAYRYDGTLNGMLCCIFASYARNSLPVGIFAEGSESQVTLFPALPIKTKDELAKRVTESIWKKIGFEALSLFRLGFLTGIDEKEMHLLRFIRFGFEHGPKTVSLVAEPAVDVITKAVQHLKGEQHLYKGFVRFSDIGGVMVAQIEPKNFVLPLLASHFAQRFNGETFMIHDKTHKAALLYSKGQKEIVKLDNFTVPAVAPNEQKYRTLWRQFYKAIAIESRENHKCRMSHMPKRYWSQMTELMDNNDDATPRIEEKEYPVLKLV